MNWKRLMLAFTSFFGRLFSTPEPRLTSSRERLKEAAELLFCLERVKLYLPPPIPSFEEARARATAEFLVALNAYGADSALAGADLAALPELRSFSRRLRQPMLARMSEKDLER